MTVLLGSVPRRYVISIMCFAGMSLSYLMRFFIAIALTAMVGSQSPAVNQTTWLDNRGCLREQYVTETHSVARPRYLTSGEFDWDERTQGVILSSFFWVYVVALVPAGLLVQRVGGKYTLLVGVLVSSLCTLLTPLVVRLTNTWGLVTLRLIMGLGQSFNYPALDYIVARWVPVEEKGRLGTLIFSGATFGVIVSMSVSGLLLSWTDGDWTVLFHLYGALGVLWSLCWLCWGYSRPEDHPGLSLSEREYLHQYSVTANIKQNLPPVPWGRLLRSAPLVGLVIAQFGHDWGYFTIINELPKYMNDVLHLSTAQTGLRSALPHLVLWLVGGCAGILADFLLTRQIASLTATRKILATVASVGPALGMLGAVQAECKQNLVTLSFITGMGLMGFFYSSLKVNVQDLSPNYAGTLSAVTMGVASTAGILTPYLVGVLIPDDNLEEWRHVFQLTAAILVLSNLVYVFTASGETQPWNNPPVPLTSNHESAKDEPLPGLVMSRL